MSFLNPAILLGLIAVAIPLIIHLFNFRRPKRVDFSSLAFLDELRQQTMRRLRIRQWLLLALRTLAIACLVLAFARPTVESGVASRVAGQGRTSAAVVIDNSMSMLQRDAEGDYLSQATEQLVRIAQGMDASDQLTVIPVIADGEAGLVRLASPVLAEDWVGELKAASGLADLRPAIAAALDALNESTHPNKELFLVSDLQASTYLDSLEASIPREVRAYVVPTGAGLNENVAVTGVEVMSSIVDLDQPVAVRAAVANHTDRALENWGVSIFLGDERVAQSAVNLDAGATGFVDLVFSPSRRGWLPGFVEIEDDAFDPDNRRFFTLHVPEVRRVLLVRGENVNTDFLEIALSQELSDGRSVFEIEVAEERSLATVSVADFDAVVLAGVQFYSSGQTTSLSDFVANGGGLLFFAGESGPAADQQALLSALGGGSLGALEGSLDQSSVLTTVSNVDPEHPVFRGVFAGSEADAPNVGNPEVYRLVSYRPGQGDEQTVIGTTSGVPLLQEIRGGSGRVLLMPLLPEPTWTDLPLRGLFVPLLYRSMYYVTSSEGESGEGIVSGSTAPIRIGSSDPSTVAIVSQSGEEWIPEQRTGMQGLLLTVPSEARDPGVYDVVSGGTVVSRIAVNGDPSESDLARLDEVDAVSRLSNEDGGPVVVLGASSDASFSAPTDGSRAGVEIWNVFMALALVFLVAEMLVAKR